MPRLKPSVARVKTLWQRGITDMDVDGNDNTPEWGYCTQPGCSHAALPIWLSGDFPDDPDLLRCERHLGSLINGLMVLLRAARPHVADQDLRLRIIVMLNEVKWEAF